MNRRSILGFAPAALFVAAAPAVAQPSDPWDAFIAAVTLLHPGLERSAREARAAGYHPDEMNILFIPPAGSDGEPFMNFRRECGPQPGPRTFPEHHPRRTEGY